MANPEAFIDDALRLLRIIRFSCKFIPPQRLQQWIIDKTFLLSFD
jgi:tRNA nucleotidyltransferase/poly(A) polymerase